jgi:hypothetical protein
MVLSRANMPLSSEVSLRPVLWKGTRSGQGFDSPKVHRRNAQPADLGVHASVVCESLLLPLRGRVAIRIRSRRMSRRHPDMPMCGHFRLGFHASAAYGCVREAPYGQADLVGDHVARVVTQGLRLLAFGCSSTTNHVTASTSAGHDVRPVTAPRPTAPAAAYQRALEGFPFASAAPVWFNDTRT